MSLKHILLLLVMIPISVFSQKTRTDANIVGHVVDRKGQHIAFATVSIKGTVIGTTTDETGHFQLINLPEGTWTVKAQYLGYKPEEVQFTLKKNETKEIKFELEEDVLGLEEVVVTANRNETNRKETAIIVNTITPKQFEITQSVNLNEGLNFTPGIRTEANCQNCGFTQVRMNGMEGPYSQILINSRPVFSGLAGVYGLELIPSNMIERVEVVRGGGSALYGSNAIAGTINVILKDPVNNSYAFGSRYCKVGTGLKESGHPANDYMVKFNTSLVSADNKTGMSLYGFYRDRDPFDANNDSFSELTSMKNTTIGTRLYHRFGARSKLTADFFNINESRRGGDKHDYLPHMAGIAESTDHNIISGGLTFDRFIREKDLISWYTSAQTVKRDSYYGAQRSLADYGATKDLSYAMGLQYNAFIGNSNIVSGIENQGAWLEDKKLGYPDIVNPVINFNDSTVDIPLYDNRTIAKQTTNTLGIFSQYEIQMNKFQISAGARFDHYVVKDKTMNHADKSGNVLSPRLTLKYDLQDDIQARLSYSQGYRAPQIFDEDLHIETSAARRVIHKNDHNLVKESSKSIMTSIDYNRQVGNSFVGVLIEGFYTRLENAFVNQFGAPDESGTVVYTRINAQDGASVQGVNIEVNYIPFSFLNMKGGFTLQSSRFEKEQEFKEKTFLRTPGDYGYFTLNWQPDDKFGISTSATYTGKMKVPYFGKVLSNNETGVLKETERFFDIGVKGRYNIRINGATLKIFAGVKNLFNAYQQDFDRGIDRDPGYIYGPALPRSFCFGIEIGNILD